jgi:hypothetical protein
MLQVLFLTDFKLITFIQLIQNYMAQNYRKNPKIGEEKMTYLLSY